MTGTWIGRGQDAHHCDKPTHEEHDRSVTRGDKWRCDECRKTWIVFGVWRGDQRDPLGPGDLPAIHWVEGT